MPAQVPESVDAWRMVSARRGFQGRAPLASLQRLKGLLFDAEGEVAFALEFDRDSLQVAYVELRINARLPLQCQRSLTRFELPVAIVQRLGLIRDEADEAAMPPGYEALLVPADGYLRPLDLVEDELVLAVPAVPMDPDTPAVELELPPRQEDLAQAGPFAALAALKKN
ncbi:MAG: DUF177 domain-containing protein [Pseudoxanthomonas sp.]